MQKYILALDQGTTGTTVSLVDHSAQVVASVNYEHPQIYPHPGWVEHNPEMIWQSVVKGIETVLRTAEVSGDQVEAIGITNQRETVVMWDAKSGNPIYNAIVWQCRRTEEFCESLKSKGAASLIKKKTGLVIDPYFSGSKLRWLLRHQKGLVQQAKGGKLKAGTMDTFLIWRLSGGTSHVTDLSNASRTQLLNIHTCNWDPELLHLFSVPKEILPELKDSSGELARTQSVPGLPDGIPISGLAGDQQAALFGQACFEAGASKCTFGTGSFLLMNTGHKPIRSRSGLLTTVAWRLKGESRPVYALEGGAFICGAAVQWLRDELKLIDSSGEVEHLAKQVSSTDGVYLVPAFVGLGAPYWDAKARGAIVGLTRGSSQNHIARATLEAMALQNVDILRCMERDLGKKISNLRVDGGAVRNGLLMQMQADFLGVRVERPKNVESTVLGAAFLAGLGVGYWPNLRELKKIRRVESQFKPAMKAAHRLSKIKEWHRAIERVRG